MTVRILIVDDHQLAREGLKSVLAGDGLEVVGEATSGEEAVDLVARLQPDVVLMDVRLGPGIDGLEATRRIAALGLPSRVLMLSLHDMPAYVREALAAGAAGYVLKDASIAELRGAVSQVMAGQSVMPLNLINAALRQNEREVRPADALNTLTPREREVLAQIAEGLTNKEIARQLGVSPATVKAHVERIIAKLGVADRTQAAVLVARAGPA
ncbi:sigma-70 family RNA polymerase sigma factor [Novosphingobium ginsenosidimutans]|uniref:Response regulator transcription factor n=1 Tax=Novosphingobium ginsenosidimutans TaxID=1176536 RepID=A0A5B8S1A0_9SPHN|nr:response regulator transcription factor [Novosphingobium ginsenosidimutans]QEA15296.1 response regulator transcription factor [Novosphingobium ginsenosidimutans]